MNKKLEKKGKKIFLDLESLGYDKLLGNGKVQKPMIVKISSFSKSASKKLEEAGGSIMKKLEE